MFAKSMLSLATLLVAMPAAAGRHTVRLDVDNDTGRSVTVFMDGNSLGTVYRGDERRFAFGSGSHHIVIKDDRGNVIYRRAGTFIAGEDLQANLLPPLSELTLIHPGGATPLLVDLPQMRPFWLLPGQRKEVELAPGMVEIEVMSLGFDGRVDRDEYRVSLRPGTDLSYRIGDAPNNRWEQPDPGWAARSSTLKLINRDDRELTVYINGRFRGTIDEDASESFEVRAGDHDIKLVNRRGRVVYDGDIRMDWFDREALVIEDGELRERERGGHGHGKARGNARDKDRGGWFASW